MTKNNTEVRDNQRTGFAMIPNCVCYLGLSVYALALYVHIKRRAGEKGECTESARSFSDHCNMSVGQVAKAKRELVDMGLIIISKEKSRHGGVDSDVITIVDIWDLNVEFMQNQNAFIAKYSTRSCGDLARSCGDTEEEPYKNNKLRRSLVNQKTVDEQECNFAPDDLDLNELLGQTTQTPLKGEEEKPGERQKRESNIPPKTTPPEKLAKKTEPVKDLSFLRHEIRPLGECFMALTKIVPLNCEIGLWIKVCQQWQSLHIDEGVIESAVKKMLRDGLTIAGPQSITAVAKGLITAKTHHEQQYPEFDKAKLL